MRKVVSELEVVVAEVSSSARDHACISLRIAPDSGLDESLRACGLLRLSSVFETQSGFIPAVVYSGTRGELSHISDKAKGRRGSPFWDVFEQTFPGYKVENIRSIPEKRKYLKQKTEGRDDTFTAPMSTEGIVLAPLFRREQVGEIQRLTFFRDPPESVKKILIDTELFDYESINNLKNPLECPSTPRNEILLKRIEKELEQAYPTSRLMGGDFWRGH